MRTTETIDLNENVAAVCAPERGNQYVGATAVVSGWGTLRSGDYLLSVQSSTAGTKSQRKLF